MIGVITQGFVLGLGYAMPIGAQNLFVLNSAMTSTFNQAVRNALVFAVVDISLAIACIAGIGNIADSSSTARYVLTGLGSAYLVILGIRLLIKSTENDETANSDPRASIWKVAILLTWLNPQAIVDGSILFGGFQSGLTPAEMPYFAAGVAVASTTWFLSLSIVANIFKTKVSTNVLRRANQLCGIILVTLGVRLALTTYGVR